MILQLRFSLLSIALLFCFSAGAQLSGNYTINSAQATGGTNFQTFNDFATDINTNGITADVIVTVAPGSGPYNEQVTFANISGAGPTSTVTIEGNGETIRAAADSANRHVIRLTDIQYFTVNNLRIERDSASTTTGFYAVHIYNTGNNITISNCSVYIYGTTSTLAGGYIASGSMTSILAGGDFSDIFIVSDTSTGGGYGASVFGLASPLAENISISECTFYDFHSNGVYLRETDGAVVKGCHFDKRTSNVTSANAIQVAQNANINTVIHHNFIKVSQQSNGTVTFRGIYLFNGTGHQVFNNVIHDVNLTSGNFTGIEVRTAGTAPEIYFNTIAIDDTAATTGNLYGIKEELSNTGSILRNNIVSISQPTSGNKAALVLGAISTVTTALNSNYNLLWAPGGNIALKNPISPTFYPTLNNWQAASTQDSVSLNLDPVFISATLSQPTNLAADNAGTPIAWITTDIVGSPRGPTPDVGAYEFPSNVGVEPVKFNAEQLCYPNPFSDQLNVKVSSSLSSEIILFNAIGGIIFRKQFAGSISVNTGKLPAGIYFYELRSDNTGSARGKLIKQ